MNSFAPILFHFLYIWV